MESEIHKLRIDKAHKARRDERSAWPWILLIVLAIAAAGGAWQWRSSAAVVVQTVRVRLPEAGSAPARKVLLNATGYIIAAHRIELASKVVGRVAWVGIEMGDKIDKGQVLVRLEDDEFKARVAQQQGQLDNAKALLAELEAGSRVEEIATARARVEQAEAELANAEISLKRLQGLEASKAISRQQLDDADALVRSRQAQVNTQRQQYAMVKAGPRKEQIEAQRATVRQLEGGLAMANLDLANTVIRSPVAATVLRRNVEVGEFVTTGFVGDRGAKGYVVSIADLTDLRVELDISQNDFAKVFPRQPCAIVTDAYPDREYAGIVDLISPEANRQKATVLVRVKVLEPDERLKPEMNATVAFLAPGSPAATQPGGGAEVPAVRVPATAVRNGFVFVAESGKAVKRAVVVGERFGQEIEVRKGLIGGEDLIVNPGDALEDGAKVKTAESGN